MATAGSRVGLKHVITETTGKKDIETHRYALDKIYSSLNVICRRLVVPKDIAGCLPAQVS